MNWRRLVCRIFGHDRTFGYGDWPDYALIVVCLRCGEKIEGVDES